ncbi:hypothetical protein M1D97_15220 [Kushneria sp. AK178]
MTAFLMDEHLITLQRMWEIALDGVKVRVAPADLETACEVLIDYRAHRLTTPSTATDEPMPRRKNAFYGWRLLVIACRAATGVVFPLPRSRDEY